MLTNDEITEALAIFTNHKSGLARERNCARNILPAALAELRAREYRISESTPREINRGRTWKDAHAAARA